MEYYRKCVILTPYTQDLNLTNIRRSEEVADWKLKTFKELNFFKFQMCKTRFTNKFLIDSNAYLKVHVCKWGELVSGFE